MKKEQQTKRDVVPAVSQSHRHRRLMFALPYPREFLCCICHAKIPHHQLRATHCLGGFPVSPFAYSAFPFQGHLQIRCLCWRPRRIPGTRHPGAGASPPGRCVGEAGRRPAGGVRPNPPGLSTVPCPGGALIDKFALVTEHRSRSGKKTARGGDGTGDNSELQPLAGDRLGLQPCLSPARRGCSRPVCRWLQLT